MSVPSQSAIEIVVLNNPNKILNNIQKKTKKTRLNFEKFKTSFQFNIFCSIVVKSMFFLMIMMSDRCSFVCKFSLVFGTEKNNQTESKS